MWRVRDRKRFWGNGTWCRWLKGMEGKVCIIFRIRMKTGNSDQLKYDSYGVTRGECSLEQQSANNIPWAKSGLSPVFLYSSWAKNSFYIFKCLGKKNQKKKNISWHMKSIWIQISVSINKVLLEHTCVHSFTYYLCVCAAEVQLSTCDRVLWTTKPKIFPTWPSLE